MKIYYNLKKIVELVQSKSRLGVLSYNGRLKQGVAKF